MATTPTFNLSTAVAFSRAGRIEEWIHAYLNAGDWVNPALSSGLKLQRRWWTGPIEMELSQLARCAGPEAGIEYPVDALHWAQLTEKMAQSMIDPRAIPPLIAEYRGGELSVRDGNTRHAAMTRKGWSTAWVIIWYNTEEDYDEHRTQLAATHQLDDLTDLRT
jgi:hypothetical protein